MTCDEGRVSGSTLQICTLDLVSTLGCFNMWSFLVAGKQMLEPEHPVSLLKPNLKMYIC